MEKIKIYVRKETVTPVVILAVLIIYVAAALNMAPPVVNGLLQESFFPLLIFIAGVPPAVLLLMDALKKINKEIADKQEKPKRKFNIKPLLIGLISIFLVVGFEPLGFFVTAPVFIFLFMLIYDDKPQRIIRKIIYTVLVVTFVYVLYTVVFNIRFPVFWS
jgi:putative tricarboxylic transport membrane protein